MLTSCAAHTGGSGTTARRTGPDLLATVKSRGTLLVSTDANYEPQSYKTPDGAWHGFDVDVARDIARRLGVRAEFLDISFDVITGGGWNGRWDVNVDSMTLTGERERVLYLSQPYYYVPASFVVHKTSTAKTIEDLAGKRIGVGTATTYQAYLEGHLMLVGEKILHPAPEARAVPYDTDQLALQDLALGDGVRLDGALTALPFIDHQIAHGVPLRVLGQPVFYEPAAVAIDKSSPQDPVSLYSAVNAAVAAMHRDGTLRRLSLHYYGVDFTQQP